jgi:hypothetical protein
LRYRHAVNGRVFAFATADLQAELGEVALSHPAVIRWLREYLSEGFAELYGGGADAQGEIG